MHIIGQMAALSAHPTWYFEVSKSILLCTRVLRSEGSGRGVEEHPFSHPRSSTFHRNIQRSQYHVRWDDQCIQQGDQPFRKGVTGKFMGKARTDVQHCEAFGNFLFKCLF